MNDELSLEEALLSQMRRAMLGSSCYVSRGMGSRKVSSSKYDFQDHSGALV